MNEELVAADAVILHKASDKENRMGSRLAVLAKENVIFMCTFVSQEPATLPDEPIQKCALCHRPTVRPWPVADFNNVVYEQLGQKYTCHPNVQQVQPFIEHAQVSPCRHCQHLAGKRRQDAVVAGGVAAYLPITRIPRPTRVMMKRLVPHFGFSAASTEAFRPCCAGSCGNLNPGLSDL